MNNETGAAEVSGDVSALVPALAKVMGSIERVKKTGRNDFHRYDYATESDILDAVRAKVAEAGVFIFSSQESVESNEVRRAKDGKEKISIMTRVRVRYTFHDGKGAVSVYAFGDSEDSDDKGIYKAVTGATKYFLSKNFLVSTGDDPEKDSAESRGDRSRTARASTPSAAWPGTVQDAIESVEKASKTNKAGKAYTLYTIHTGKNGTLNTFDKGIGEDAEEAAGTGVAVSITAEPNGQYNPKCLSIAPVNSVAQGSKDPADDLPF